MNQAAKITVIFVVLLLELAWAAWPHFGHGAIADESYRHTERMVALSAWLNHETPETKAAFDAEVKLLDQQMFWRAVAILAGGLVLNIFGIYWFWRYALKKIAD